MPYGSRIYKPKINYDQSMKRLKESWELLRYHPEQSRLWQATTRFNVVPAGRRSGKTEICGKRKLITCALKGTRFPNPKFFAAAPTRDQAKRIYWKDLKEKIPGHLRAKEPSESHLIMYLINGAEIHVLGMDKPERAEGTPWDGGILDEYANMKKTVWTQHVRAALSDRQGWCDFIGVPEGRNHYYDLYKDAKAHFEECLRKGEVPEWNAFWWKSADILPPSEIEAAIRDLDDLTFRQEYEASFENFSGRAYYPFEERLHCARLEYNPQRTLEFCFDFNVEPGVAAVVQEQYLSLDHDEYEYWGDGVIGEVYIPRNSNTIAVCKKLIKDWKNHQGKIYCYGDYTGGSRGSSKILGSDWQLIKQALWSHFGHKRVFMKVKPNPRQRQRINSLNSRLMSYAGIRRMMVDPSRAPHVVKDLEGTVLLEGGSGEIDKRKCEESGLSHLSDALGYRIWEKYPVKKHYAESGQKYWK